MICHFKLLLIEKENKNIYDLCQFKEGVIRMPKKCSNMTRFNAHILKCIFKKCNKGVLNNFDL